MHPIMRSDFQRSFWVVLALTISLCGPLAAADPPAAATPAAPRFVDGLKEQTARVARLRDGTLIAIFLQSAQNGTELAARYSRDNGRIWGEIQALSPLPKAEMGWGSPEPLVDQDGELHVIYLKGRKKMPSG